LLDVWQLFYPDYGRGVDGFMNVSSFVPFNIVLIGLPPVSNLAGIVKAGDQGVQAAALVLETANHPTNIGLTFPNGVTFLGALRAYSDFFGKRGTHTLAAWYVTGDFTSLDTDGWINNPMLGTPPTNAGSWSATYLAEQRLWQDPANERRYTNFFAYVDFADSKINPYEVTAGGSIETFGFLSSRPGDRMGIAGFYNGLGDFADLLNVLTPTGDSVYGGEFYYNAEITPAFHLTFDLQAVEPSFKSLDTAIVTALRAKLDF
jgi:hypothetical protein